MDMLLNTMPGYSSFRMQLASRRGPWCSFLLTIILAVIGFIIFCVQAGKSNSAGSFYAFHTDKHESSQSYYETSVPLPKAVVCPGTGFKRNNILDQISSLDCTFYTDGGASKTDMSTEKLDPVTMLLFDGTEEKKVRCFSVDGSESRSRSMYDVAKCDVYFDLAKDSDDRPTWQVYNDLKDDMSRVFFLSNHYDWNNTDIDGDSRVITDPKEMPLYWHRISPMATTVFDIDFVYLQTRHKKIGNHGVVDWFKGNYVETVPNEWVNLTQYKQYFNNHPVMSFTYGYGEFFAQDLKEIKVYPSYVAMGVVFGYAYMLSLLGLVVMFMLAWVFQFEYPIWSWNNTYIAADKVSTSEPPPQYYSSSFGQKQAQNTVIQPSSGGGSYGSI